LGIGLPSSAGLRSLSSDVPVASAELGLQPYLQNPQMDGMTIMWRTVAPAYSWVEYGEDQDRLKIARTVENGIVSANVTRHKVRISNLNPNTRYYYRICTQDVQKYQAYSKELGPVEKSDFFSFTTLGTVAKDFACLIFTDLHDNLTLFDKLMAQVQAHNITFDFSIFNGDIFNDPASEGQILNLIRHYNQGVDAARKPAFYLRGNHEIRGPYALQWPSFFDFENGETYFAFSYGDTRFVMLDNGEDKNDGHVEYSKLVDFDEFRDRQTAWLREELAGDAFQQAFRKVLVHHIPIYSWTNSWDPGFMPCYDRWDPIFNATPFDIDITGHLHQFNFYPKNRVGNPFPLVVGGGNTEDNGRVMILIKRGDVLTLKSLDVAGNLSVHPIYQEDVSLTGVTVTGGKLSPAFDPQRADYDVLVTSQICKLTITGQPSSESATVRGNITNKTCTIGERILLTVTADDGTRKQYTFTVKMDSTANANLNGAPQIKLYPNPLDRGMALRVDLDAYYNDVTVRIFDEAGSMMQTSHAQGQYLMIPLALQQGAYFLSLTTDQKKTGHKFIVR
jgi:hypothetical protein